MEAHIVLTTIMLYTFDSPYLIYSHPTKGDIYVPIPTKNQQEFIAGQIAGESGPTRIEVDVFMDWPILSVFDIESCSCSYYLNLLTLKPTKKSPIQTPLPDDIRMDLMRRKRELDEEYRIRKPEPFEERRIG